MRQKGVGEQGKAEVTTEYVVPLGGGEGENSMGCFTWHQGYHIAGGQENTGGTQIGKTPSDGRVEEREEGEEEEWADTAAAEQIVGQRW